MTDAHRPAVFVDRDNTLIEDPGYISHPDQVRLLPGVAEAVARLRAAGYPVVVVSNQSGVARGYFTEDDLTAVHRRMQQLLGRQNAGVDGIYYCPFLAGEEATVDRYRRDSDLRKPKPGMLRMAADDLGLDLRKSWMVGDSVRDAEAGRAAGCRTILIGARHDGGAGEADYRVADLSAAADTILAEDDPEGGGDAEALTPSPDKADVHPRSEAESNGAPAGVPEPRAEALPGGTDETLRLILEELRTARRERQYADFSIAHLAGAVAQAFALCAIGWGLYNMIDAMPEQAVPRLLVGIAFQMMALTGFVAGKRR